MKKICVLLFIIHQFSLATEAQTTSMCKEKVQKDHQSFFDGILAEDYQLVDQLLAEDVMLGFPHGGFTPKKEYVDGLKNKTLFYDDSSHESLQVRTYGNTGVVNGRSNLTFRYLHDGNWYKMHERLSYTAVYVMGKNKIKMVAWQSNRPNTDTVEM